MRRRMRNGIYWEPWWKQKKVRKKLEFLQNKTRVVFLKPLQIKHRGNVIRTRDLYVPNVALYQAEPCPVNY